MTNFWNYLATNSNGIFVLLVCLGAGVLVVQWITWIFAWGRFKPRSGDGSSQADKPKGLVRYLLEKLIGKSINEFRHLLALLIVFIFAVALGYVLVVAQSGTTGGIEELKDALTVVVSTLGSLVSLILGYYFGEQAGASSDGALPSAGLSLRSGPTVSADEPVAAPIDTADFGAITLSFEEEGALESDGDVQASQDPQDENQSPSQG